MIRIEILRLSIFSLLAIIALLSMRERVKNSEQYANECGSEACERVIPGCEQMALQASSKSQYDVLTIKHNDWLTKVDGDWLVQCENGQDHHVYIRRI